MECVLKLAIRQSKTCVWTEVLLDGRPERVVADLQPYFLGGGLLKTGCKSVHVPNRLAVVHAFDGAAGFVHCIYYGAQEKFLLEDL